MGTYELDPEEERERRFKWPPPVTAERILVQDDFVEGYELQPMELTEDQKGKLGAVYKDIGACAVRSQESDDSPPETE
jgi:hypothetical protein